MSKIDDDKIRDLERGRNAQPATPIELKDAAMRDIARALNAHLADVFARFLKSKNFQWRVSGPHFRDCHLAGSREDNASFASSLRTAPDACSKHRDGPDTSTGQSVDEAERRAWFLFELKSRGE